MDNSVDEIKRRLDIVDLIREYLTLKKAGSNWKGLCPFHHEKSPSFMVSQDKQIFHCFGCGEGGDIFEFVQKMEGLDFYEALKLLAFKSGVKLEQRDPNISKEKNLLIDIVKDSSDFFHQILLKHPKAKEALEYVKKRELQDDTIATFQIGYAPDSFHTLANHLKQKKHANNLIVKAGMCLHSQKQSGIYDRFRDRIMIPLCNEHGVTVGFTGRQLHENKETGKYVNTPQTPLYDKSKLLFGLHLAKQSIRKLDYVILVEGNMDMIASYQGGVHNVVATSGTALTQAQLDLLKRYTKNLMFCFDDDAAGIQAAFRGIALGLQNDFNIKAIILKAGKDPDDCIKEDVQLWKDSIKEAQPFMDYYMTKVIEGLDVSEIANKKKAASQILGMIVKLQSPIEQEHYVKKLSDLLDISQEVLQKAMETPKETKTKKQETSEAQQEIQKAPKEFEIVDRILSILIAHPIQSKYVIDQLSPEVFFKYGEDVYKNIVSCYNANITNSLDLADFLRYGEDTSEHCKQQFPILQMLFEKEYAHLSTQDVVRELVQLTNFLKQQYIRNTLKSLEIKIRQAEAGQGQEDAQRYFEQFQELSTELAKLGKEDS